MTAQEIAEAIAERVRREGDATFVMLAQDMPEHFQSGAMEIGLLDRNIVYWQNASPEALEAIEIFRRMPGMSLEPTQPLCYLIDGGVLSLPFARSIRAYDKPHWLPMLFTSRTSSATSQPPAPRD